MVFVGGLLLGIGLAGESGFDTVAAGMARPDFTGGDGGAAGLRLADDGDGVWMTSEISTSLGTGVDRFTTTCFAGAVLLGSFFVGTLSFTGVPARVTEWAG